MPGSIQVSVLDFKELPDSSNSLKVSLGKVEYETADKGTFSFPLTNLRDNLIITVQDSQGNQVSHSGVRTKSIIEKGTWDDLFPIEGGGLIHMKLQFILSDEERNRIRSMRESAMKKKQEEILNNRLRNAGRLEVSDVLTATSSQDFQRSGFKAGSDDTSGKAAESSDGLKEESFQNPTFPNATDRREETLSSPIREKALVEDTKTRALSTNLVKNKSPELDKQNLEEKISSDFKGTSLESTSTLLLQETEVNSTKINEIRLQDDVPERLQEGLHQKPLVEDTKTRVSSTDLVKDKSPDSNTSNNPAGDLDKQNLEEKITSDFKATSLKNASTSLLLETEDNLNNNNEIKLQQANVLERCREGVREKALIVDTKTRELTDFVEKNEAAESKPSDNLVKKLDKQNLEEKVRSFVTKANEKSKPSVVQLQQSDDPERLQEVGSSRSIIAEKIKSFSPIFAGEPNKQVPPEKTARNIRKMISVFESSISQDREPLKPLGMKSYRIGSSRLLKDNAVKDHSDKSESSSKGLRKSFSANDLRKNVLGIGKTEEKIGFDNDFVEPNERNMQSKEDRLVSADPKETGKFALMETNAIELPKSPEEDATVSGRTLEEDEESNNKRTENISDECDGATSFLADRVNEEKSQSHQEKTVSYVPESIVEDKGNSSPKVSDEEASIGSIGQVVKIALVVGFGVLVLLFRHREQGKSKKKENDHAFKTRVFMKKRGSIEEQLRRSMF